MIRWDQPLRFKAPVNYADSEWLHNQAKSQAGQDLFVIAMTQGKVNGCWLEIGCGDPVRSNNTYLLETRLGWSGVSIDTALMDQDIITPFEEYWHSFYHSMRREDWPTDPVPFEQLPRSAQDRFANYYHAFIERQISPADSIPRHLRNWSTVRPNTRFHQGDAFAFDYGSLPTHMDYLQVDIHPSLNNLRMLEKILPSHEFSVITFEHDVWDHSEDSRLCRMASRELLESQGYCMVISDATVPPGHGNGIGDEPINFEDWWVHPDRVPSDLVEVYQDLDDSGLPKYYWHTLFNPQAG